MNIELEIKDIKHDLNYAKKCEYDHVTLDVYKVQTLLTAYEKEKEKNKKLEADIEMFTKKFDNESLECRIKQKIAKLNYYNSIYLISNGKYSEVIQKQIEILQDTLKDI